MTLANFAGYLALAIMAFALVRKDNRHLLFLIGVGLFLWAIHYWLIGSTAGAINHLIAGIGVFLAHSTYQWSIRKRIVLAAVFAALAVAGSLFTGFSTANILAALGGVIMTASQYIFRGVRMRQGFLAGEGFFFFFALLIGSVPGMLVTVMNALSGITGLVRIHKSRLSSVPDTPEVSSVV